MNAIYYFDNIIPVCRTPGPTLAIQDIESISEMPVIDYSMNFV